MSLRTCVAALALTACTAAPWPDAAGSGAGSSTAAPAPAPTTGASSTTTDDSSTGTTTSTGTTGPFNFIKVPDGGGIEPECNPWYETCPFGQKCMPYSNDGDNSVDAYRCVTIVPDPGGLYDPCTAPGGGASGEDTCDIHLVCWDLDPDTGEGTCVGMCVGEPDDRDCADPHATCAISGNGVLNLCLPMCDPIAQDCFGDDVCVPNPGDPDRWICLLDGSDDEGQAFDPCAYVNACDPGLVCSEPAFAVECDPMALGCCLPLCDTDEPNTCPGEGHECVPWYDDLADAAPHNVDVGLCRLPMP